MATPALSYAVIGEDSNASPALDFHQHPNWKQASNADNADVAILNLPTRQQAIEARRILEAGKHVVASAPLAISLEASKTLLTLAADTQAKLITYLPLRHTPEAMALKALATPETIGHAFHAYTRWTSRNRFPKLQTWKTQTSEAGGGALMDQGIHRIDLAWWLMDCPIVENASAVSYDHFISRVQGGATERPDVEDFAGGLIRFEGGASILFESSWGSCQGIAENRATRVMAQHGTLVHRDLKGQTGYHAFYIREENGEMIEQRLPTNTIPASDIASVTWKLLTESCDPIGIANYKKVGELHAMMDKLYQA